jgi:hypothetical protein
MTTSCNCSYRHVSLFNESDDRFGKLDKDYWTSMFNAECIIKSSILKAILHVDAISKALVFFKSKDMSLLYKRNNSWIMSFNIKNLLILAPPVKNKHIDVSGYNYFLCITSSNIDFFSPFHCLNKCNIQILPSSWNIMDLWNFDFLRIVIFYLIHHLIE